MHVSTYHPTLRRRNDRKDILPRFGERWELQSRELPRQAATLIGQRNYSGRLGMNELVLNGAAGNLRRPTYRTEIPDLLVYILAAIFIDASSWKSNLAA